MKLLLNDTELECVGARTYKTDSADIKEDCYRLLIFFDPATSDPEELLEILSKDIITLKATNSDNITFNYSQYKFIDLTTKIDNNSAEICAEFKSKGE